MASAVVRTPAVLENHERPGVFRDVLVSEFVAGISPVQVVANVAINTSVPTIPVPLVAVSATVSTDTVSAFSLIIPVHIPIALLGSEPPAVYVGAAALVRKSDVRIHFSTQFLQCVNLSIAKLAVLDRIWFSSTCWSASSSQRPGFPLHRSDIRRLSHCQGRSFVFPFERTPDLERCHSSRGYKVEPVFWLQTSDLVELHDVSAVGTWVQKSRP